VNNVTIINNTTIINNIHIDRRTNNTYFTGPNRNEVERNTGREVKPVVVENSAKPGQTFENGKVTLYRPRVTASTNNPKLASAPAHVMKRNDITPVSLRATDNVNDNRSLENTNDKAVASARAANVIRRVDASDVNANNNVQLNQSRGQIQKAAQPRAISRNTSTQSAINNRKTMLNAQPVIHPSSSVLNENRNANVIQQKQSRNSATLQSRSIQNNPMIKNAGQRQSPGTNRVQSNQAPHSK